MPLIQIIPSFSKNNSLKVKSKFAMFKEVNKNICKFEENEMLNYL